MDDQKTQSAIDSPNAIIIIEEGVAVDESPTLADEVSTGAVDAYQQVDFLVKSLINDQIDLRDKIKEQRSMLKDVLMSDTNYRDIDTQTKELNKRKKEIQNGLMSTEGVRSTQEELRAMQEDLKTIDKKLSSFLKEYVESNNSRTIEVKDGQLREIITLYKVVKKVIG